MNSWEFIRNVMRDLAINTNLFSNGTPVSEGACHWFSSWLIGFRATHEEQFISSPVLIRSQISIK